VKSEPLEEIRVDLDRRTAKRKQERTGFLVQMHPSRKEEKMLGVLGWVGNFDVAEASL